MAVVEREELCDREIEDTEAGISSVHERGGWHGKCGPEERLAALFLAKAFRDSVLLELSEASFRVRVLPPEPVLARLRVVFAADVPALDVRQVVLEVEL